MSERSVFITGAATGIGLATARKLDAMGWRVFAGVLPDQDRAALTSGSSDRLRVVPIDLTSDDLVSAAASEVGLAVGASGLSALINNAGVANLGTGVLEGVSQDAARALFGINVFGTLRVTQAFLPLLHRYGPARIVNLSSGAARVPVPTSGIYNMSKSAIDAMTKTLRYELAPFGIEVTAVEPGAVKTPMTDNAQANLDKMWDDLRPDLRERYEPVLRRTHENLVKAIDQANPPELIADGVIRALTVKNPRPRYTAGREVRFLPIVQGLMTEAMFERVLMGQFGLVKGSAAKPGRNAVRPSPG